MINIPIIQFIHSRKNATLKRRNMGKNRNIDRQQTLSRIIATHPKITLSAARRQAGYSEKTHARQLTRAQVHALESVAQSRERIQHSAGNTIDDSINIYRRLSTSTGIPASDQIAARKQLDRLLGYEAPQQVDVNNNIQVNLALQYLQGVIDPYDLIVPRQIVPTICSVPQLSIAK